MEISFRPNVIFIGSFKEAKDGSIGGQMFACKSILESDVANHVNFLLIDSTVDSIPVPPVHKRFLKVFNRFFLLFKYLFTKKVDKVLIFSSTGLSFIEKGAAAFVCRLFGKKVIFAPRSGFIKEKVQTSALFRAYVRFILRISYRVICQSENWKTFYESVYQGDDDKYIVILNWIDMDRYIQNNPVYNNKPGPATMLLYIGRIEKYKGIFDLIEAMSMIRDKVPGLQINLYGSGRAEKPAIQLCRKYGLQDILLFKGIAGYRTKMAALASADMFVLPSHSEGFPNSLLEAMASGLPSIACNAGGVSEILIAGQTGLLIEKPDPKALAEAIYALYSDPALRARLSGNGRKMVLTKDSLPIAEKKFIELLAG